jgi:hypothetical protein
LIHPAMNVRRGFDLESIRHGKGKSGKGEVRIAECERKGGMLKSEK